MSELIISYKGHTWAVEIGNQLIGGDDIPFIAQRQFCSEKDYKTTIPHPTVLQTVQDALSEMGLCEPVMPKYEGDPLDVPGYKRTNSIEICTKYPSLVGSDVLIPGHVTWVDPWQRFQIDNETWFEADDSTVYLKERQDEPTAEI